MPKSTGKSRSHATGRSIRFSVGSILWLPAKENIDGSLLADSSIDEGVFNHPFLILSLDSPSKVAVGFILTSFHGKDLMERYPDNPRCPSNRRIRQYYLPISPCSAHPDNGILIFLQGKRVLRSKSYINTRNRVAINCGALERYDRDGTRYKLELESFKVLTSHINLASLPTRPVLRDISTNLHSLPIDQQPGHGTRSFQSTQPVDLHRLLSDRFPPRTVSPIRPQAPPIFRSQSFHTPLPVIRESWEDRQMYGVRTRNERTPLLPTHKSTKTQKPRTCVRFSSLALWLIFWSLAAYGGYWIYLLLRSRL